LKKCLNLLDEWECNFDYKIITIPIKLLLELSIQTLLKNFDCTMNKIEDYPDIMLKFPCFELNLN